MQDEHNARGNARRIRVSAANATARIRYVDFELHDFSIELSLDLVQLSLPRDSKVYRASSTWRYPGIYESRHRREI